MRIVMIPLTYFGSDGSLNERTVRLAWPSIVEAATISALAFNARRAPALRTPSGQNVLAVALSTDVDAYVVLFTVRATAASDDEVALTVLRVLKRPAELPAVGPITQLSLSEDATVLATLSPRADGGMQLVIFRYSEVKRKYSYATLLLPMGR